MKSLELQITAITLVFYELVAKFDPFLRDHIDLYGNTDSGKPSYLSKTICDKIIQLMANKVKDTIMAEVKKDGYFSFSVDSTSDISHTDQLALIIRYVSPEDGLPTEGFLTFLELKDPSGESINDLVFNYISFELKIDFRKCRGQSYDNVANMAGRYNERWAVLKSHLKPHFKVPKYLSDTRWEAHAKATEAILENYNDITDALNYLHSDNNTKGDTRLRAKNLLEKMEEFEIIFVLYFWNRVLRHFSKVNKILQSSNILLSSCADWYRSLLDILRGIREDFDALCQLLNIELPER
ncbi:zinc finger MYM-type protein 1 [Caerostris darwini]|uniref:Zinc finger MYM-type protein 1 n=1 Tax=Caerostris darwini TaxID=1538125 RepID=A0AAV4UPS2_9ARAC|nr:zinc finger MYM-type protein 1 [Caerostris darwini]